MKYELTTVNGQNFFLYPLEREDVAVAKSLCDECVGANLYSEDDILRAVKEEDAFFYLLKTDNGEPVGYIFYLITDEESIAKYAKLGVATLSAVYPNGGKRVGKMQSVGVKECFRGMGLATRLFDFALEELSLSVEAVFAVCWKQGKVVPVGKVLARCGFEYLTDAKKVWYDDVNLICPYCKGRCTCDAAVYYKLFKRGGEA